MQKALYLISYDVVCQKRRTRLYKRLSQHGFTLQQSVFVTYDYLKEIKALCQVLRDEIDEGEDRLLCLTIQSNGFRALYKPTVSEVEIMHSHPLLSQLLN
ncbi:CRISPR-associated endonuclease Cas2 [Paraglaciecola sp. Hal342]|jgi:CRISPR-associated endonuclease Cas2